MSLGFLQLRHSSHQGFSATWGGSSGGDNGGLRYPNPGFTPHALTPMPLQALERILSTFGWAGAPVGGFTRAVDLGGLCLALEKHLYSRVSELGRGMYGTVWCVVNRETGKQYGGCGSVPMAGSTASTGRRVKGDEAAGPVFYVLLWVHPCLMPCQRLLTHRCNKILTWTCLLPHAASPTALKQVANGAYGMTEATLREVSCLRELSGCPNIVGCVLPGLSPCTNSQPLP